MLQYEEELERYLSGLNINRDEFTSQEKLILSKIISQIDRTGKSSLLDSLYKEDYDEKPVSINRFLEDPEYLGAATNGGKDVYPFWRDILSEVFSPKFQYVKCIFSGAIGTGKSSVACLGIDYVIYKLLCLKDPAKYYNVMKGSKPGVALFNITLDKGFGVAFYKINTALKDSPWFLRNGSIIGSRTNEIYQPGKNVTIGVGSMADHFIGLDIFCLSGDTIILTEHGPEKLKFLPGKPIRVYTYDKGIISLSNETEVIQTGYTNEIIRITLDDGSIIECTPNHRFLVSNCGYVSARDLKFYNPLETWNNVGRYVEQIKQIKLDYEIPVYDVLNVKPHHNFLIQGNCSLFPSYIISHNCTMMDEMSFKDNKELNMQKMKAYEALQAIDRRMTSRFMDKGIVPGISFLISSTRTEDDFLAQYKETRRDDPRTLIVERPLYEVLPKEKTNYRGEKFNLAIGIKSADQFIIQKEEVDNFKDRGYSVYEVPMEYYNDFKDDMLGSIRDILGVALKTAGRFLDSNKIENSINDNLINIFSTTEIPLGFSDSSSILDYLVIGNINPKLIKYPIFVHHDLSLGGDGTGIVASALCKNSEYLMEMSENETDDWIFIPIFWIRVVPKYKGEQIPFYKIRKDIIKLRDEYGFNILGASADGYQSADMLQQYKLNGFWTMLLSMDKAPSTPYYFFRSCAYDGRVQIPNDEIILRELNGLIENRRAQKIDHGIGGCFIGETKIRLVDGRDVSINDLMIEQAYKTNWVYSVNEKTGIIEPKRIRRVFYSKSVRLLVKAILDNDQEIYCTPEHRFMLGDGSYKEIIDIEVGTPLMSLSNAENYKLMSIEVINRRCLVYDLEIEDNPNFSLSSGVFAHNSKDIVDALGGSVYAPVEYNKTNKIFSAGNYLYSDLINRGEKLNPSMNSITPAKLNGNDLSKQISSLIFNDLSGNPNEQFEDDIF